jgi:hypothetical protein
VHENSPTFLTLPPSPNSSVIPNMPPNDDVERPRASSAAERQKSIVSMTEFEGMDEYTALQKYILFYRDNRTNPHAETAPKKKAWWQFWKSGSATAAAPIEDSGAVPDERKLHSLPSPSSPCCMRGPLHHAAQLRATDSPLLWPLTRIRWLDEAPSELKLLAALRTHACAAAAVEPIRGDPPTLQLRPTKLLPGMQHAR